MSRKKPQSAMAALLDFSDNVLSEDITAIVEKPDNKKSEIKKADTFSDTYLNENLILASRNIPNIEVTEIKSLNPISLLKHEAILINEDCFKELEELYS